jgi:hypothetical protein
MYCGDLGIHIDNCERAIVGDFLCSMLTQEIVQARILALSERRILPSTALVLASGNNFTLAGDTTRRAVISRLDAGVERPDTRTFDFDRHAEVLAARPELVVAGLTTRAWRRLSSTPRIGGTASRPASLLSQPVRFTKNGAARGASRRSDRRSHGRRDNPDADRWSERCSNNQDRRDHTSGSKRSPVFPG